MVVAKADESPAGSTRPKGGLRAAQREFTRLRFIDSAVAVFAEQGYSRTTVDDIVRRAGATRATFYLHFKGKADILVELHKRVLAAFDGMYAELPEIVGSPTIQSIRGWLAHAVERWALAKDYVVPLWDGAVIEPEIRVLVEEGDHDQLRLLAQALAASASAGSSCGEAVATDHNLADAEITAAILLMPMRHFFGLYVRNRPLDLDRVLDALAHAWLAVMAAQADPSQSASPIGH